VLGSPWWLMIPSDEVDVDVDVMARKKKSALKREDWEGIYLFQLSGSSLWPTKN
jgi:hypothetical protein